MLLLSENMLIFAPWFRENPRHRGELLSFDPPDYLEDSSFVLTHTGIPALGDFWRRFRSINGERTFRLRM